MLHPGEVVLIPFPYIDLATTKRRPVLVLRPSDAFGDFLIGVTSRSAVCSVCSCSCCEIS